MPAAARRNAVAGMLLCAGGALLFASKGVVTKLLYARGVDFETVVVLRAVLALPLFWGWALFKAGPRAVLCVRPGAVLAAAAAGLLCYCVGSLLDFYALTLINANLERALLFSYPAMIVIAAAVIGRRPPSPRMASAVGLTWLGVAMTVGVFDREVLAANAAGAVAVMLCAASFATYFLVSERYIREIGSLPFTVHAMTAAAAGLVAWYAWRHAALPVPAGAANWALLLTLILFATVAPVILMAEGVRRIGAQRGAVASTVGPPFTIALAWVVLGEALRLDQLLGTLVIVAGILVLELARARPGRR